MSSIAIAQLMRGLLLVYGLVNVVSAHADNVTGTWVQQPNRVSARETAKAARKAGLPQSFKVGGTLLTSQKGHKVRFELHLQNGAPAFNSGVLEGEFDIQAGRGAYRSNQSGACEITFEFKNAHVELTESAEKHDCGFGHSVFADGEYVLRSQKNPRFFSGAVR